MFGLYLLFAVAAVLKPLGAESNPGGMTDADIKKGNLTFSLCSVAVGLVCLAIVIAVICVNRKKAAQEGR